MKLKKWLLFLMLPLLFLLDLKLFTATAQADVLKNAITDIKIWDHSNGREATKVNGAYNLIQGGNYRYELTFDLSAYDNQLKDGDTFGKAGNLLSGPDRSGYLGQSDQS